MKTRIVCFLMLTASVFYACESVTTSGIEQPRAGQVHTELLESLYSRMDNARGPKGVGSAVSQEEMAYQAAREVALRYGETPLTREQVHAAIEMGRTMALLDPDELVQDVLNPLEYKWWNAYASRATPEDARDVYDEMCAIYGVPTPGTALATLVDITLSSAEFWVERHADDEPVSKNPYVPLMFKQSSWRERLLRFTVSTVVDGVSGIAASGTATVVGGVIIGSLASHGADCILFGCTD